MICNSLNFALSPTTPPADGSSQPWYGACDYARSVARREAAADPSTYTLPAGELQSLELAHPSSKRARVLQTGASL